MVFQTVTLWGDDSRSYLRMRYLDGASLRLISTELRAEFGMLFERKNVTAEVERLGLPSRYLKGKVEIIAKRAEGKTAKTIALETGNSLTTIKSRISTLLSYGMIIPKWGGPLSATQIADLDPFSSRVRHLRIALGLSQRELAKNMKFSRVAIQKWETGSRKPTPSSARALAAALGVSVDMLLYGQENPLHRAISRR